MLIHIKSQVNVSILSAYPRVLKSVLYLRLAYLLTFTEVVFQYVFLGT